MTAEVVFDLAWVGAIIGFFLPLLISFMKQQTWSVQTKRVLALVTSLVAGVVNTGIQQGWEFTTAGEFATLAIFSVMDVYVTSAVVYNHFWEDTAPEAKLASIGESKPGPGPE
jgi:hypothetical protein